MIRSDSKYFRKAVLYLIPEKATGEAKYNKIINSVHSVSLVFWTSITNEKTLHSTLLSIPIKAYKVVIIFFDEFGLQNTKFRKCVHVLLASSLKLIVIVDKHLTKDRVLGYFSLRGRKSNKLDDLMKNCIRLNEKDQLASNTVSKIRQMTASKVLDRNSLKKLTTTVPPPKDLIVEKRLHQCFIQQKVTLLEPIRKKSNCCSYNLTHTVGNWKRSSSVGKPNGTRFTRRNLMSAPINTYTNDEDKKLFRKFTETPPSAEVLTSRLPRLPARETPAKDVAKTRCRQKESKVSKNNCPAIEITSEDDRKNIPGIITKENKNMPWQQQKSINQTELHQRLSSAQLTKRLSFDYVSKTYMVCDPAKSKGDLNELLYVPFPQGLGLLKRDSDAFSTADSRRNSILFSLCSSVDDLNLESVYQSALTESSPIPSPNLMTKKIYQEPLPAFSEGNCFPPIAQFPCESLQKRRPSVFDVLKSTI